MKLVNFIKDAKVYPDYISVENIVKEIELNVQTVVLQGTIAPCVYYKDVPLWLCLTSKPYTRAFLMKPQPESGESYSLVGYTPVGEYDQVDDINTEVDDVDITTYGDWVTLEDALAWLERPVKLY